MLYRRVFRVWGPDRLPVVQRRHVIASPEHRPATHALARLVVGGRRGALTIGGADARACWAAVFARVAEPGAEYPAEVLSIGVLPGYRGAREESGHTIRVAHELVQHAFAALRHAGISHVRALVKLEEDDPVARRFWQREGCVYIGRTRRYDIATDFLLKDLQHETIP